MQVTIQFEKTLQENASEYYEKSKKAKKKLAGLEKAVLEMGKKITRASEKKETAEQLHDLKKKREKQWFEKFHWFNTSEQFLVIAGRDAKSNESLVKKYMDKSDVYFHAEIFGAPHTVLKTGKKKPKEISLMEAAQFAAIFSRAWKLKLPAADVYSAKPEQVSKSAPTGEAIGTGAFMIYGKRDWFKKTPLEFAVGTNAEGKIISGPKNAIASQTKNFIQIEQGEETTGSAAKQVKKMLEHAGAQKLDLYEIISMLPAGGVKLRKKS